VPVVSDCGKQFLLSIFSGSVFSVEVERRIDFFSSLYHAF
jgi:hypothetical protein